MSSVQCSSGRWGALLCVRSAHEADLDENFERLVDLQYTKTIRLFALDFYLAIVDSGCALVNYHAIEISSS